MGQLATSEKCQSFEPNLRNIEDTVADEGAFLAFSRIISTLSDNNLRTAGALLMMEGQTRQAGYKLGQVVYIRYRGRASANYMSNFMKAHVMFVNSTHFRLMSKDGKCVLTYTKDCAPHILTSREFAELREDMLSKGRTVDPDVQRSLSRRLQAQEDYALGITKESMSGSVTTIDTVFRENKVKRKAGLNDLVSIVSDIESGFLQEKGQTDSYRKKSKKKKSSLVKTAKRGKFGIKTISV